MIYLKPTNNRIGRGSNERTPFWIYLLSAAPFIIGIIMHNYDLIPSFQEIMNFQPFCGGSGCGPNEFNGIRVAHLLMIYGVWICFRVGKKEKIRKRLHRK